MNLLAAGLVFALVLQHWWGAGILGALIILYVLYETYGRK